MDFIRPRVAPVAMPSYLNCLKRADMLVVNVEDRTPLFAEKTSFVSTVHFEDAAGELLPDCVFRFFTDLGYDEEASESFKIAESGAGAEARTVADGETTVRGFAYGSYDDEGAFVPEYRAGGLQPLSLDDVVDLFVDRDNSYSRFVSLFDGDSNARGGRFSDRLEVGAGDDTVQAAGGDDVVYKWRPGDLTYKGGAGRDTLDFSAQGETDSFPTPLAEPLSINLATGEGRNPYGGALQLSSVEALVLPPGEAEIVGSKRAETVKIGPHAEGVSDIRLKAGADVVTLYSRNAAGSVLDGGMGRDRVEVAVEGNGRQVLDLLLPARNSGDFDDLTIRNFEDVRLSVLSLTANFRLMGTGGANDLTVSATLGAVKVRIDGRGGDDTLFGSDMGDVLRGGKGSDALNGYRGDDTLIGGPGPDRFVFWRNTGNDTVRDFGPGDVLDFSGHFDVNRRADLTVTRAGDDTILDDGAGLTVRLENVLPRDLTADSFMFDAA